MLVADVAQQDWYLGVHNSSTVTGAVMHGCVSVLIPLPVALRIKLFSNLLAGLENSTLPQAKDTNVATMLPSGEPFAAPLEALEAASPGHLWLPQNTTSMLHRVGIVPLVIIQHAAEARQC